MRIIQQRNKVSGRGFLGGGEVRDLGAFQRMGWRRWSRMTLCFSSTLLLVVGSLTAQDVHEQRHQASISQAKRALEQVSDVSAPESFELLVRLADAHLRAGDAAQATALYQQAIQRRGEAEPYLWQYGIALFFVNRFAEGRDLFVKHRKVNPRDVENAAWHFLCAAKATDLQKARKILLPAPDDPRPPMKQILTRLAGGDDQEIEAAVAALVETPAYDSARFYADLYLGLIADAEGDSAAAQRYIQQAAKTKATNYMADVARVYWQHLQNVQE